MYGTFFNLQQKPVLAVIPGVGLIGTAAWYRFGRPWLLVGAGAATAVLAGILLIILAVGIRPEARLVATALVLVHMGALLALVLVKAHLMQLQNAILLASSLALSVLLGEAVLGGSLSPQQLWKVASFGKVVSIPSYVAPGPNRRRSGSKLRNQTEPRTGVSS